MQKLHRLLVCSAVLATVALSAPGTALAAPPHGVGEPFYGLYGPDRTFISRIYTKTESSPDVVIQPGEVGDGACFQLYDERSRTYTSRQCTKGDALTLSGVRTGDPFSYKATKSGNDPSNNVSGWIFL